MNTYRKRTNAASGTSQGSSAQHSRLINETLIAIGKHCASFARCWRNETGMAKNIRTDELFKYGLVGSSDIFVIQAVKITPEMVGQTLGVFTGFECKTGNSVQSTEQKNFETMFKRFGGRYYVVRSAQDAVNFLLGQSAGACNADQRAE